MTLTQNELQKQLGERPFRFFSTVDSTQDIALEWLRQGAEAGAVVIADEQVKGRGRYGRTWHTPSNVAIAMSVILRPPPNAMNQITMLGAIAIYDMLVELGLAGMAIKWPNDVLVNGHKISGVLPEAAWDGDKLRGVALGMGINVRVDFSNSSLRETAISIESALGHRVSRAEISAILLKRIDYWALRLGTPEIFDMWKSRLVTLGQHVSVGDVIGIAQTVDRDGALRIRTESGELKRVLAGDIALG